MTNEIREIIIQTAKNQGFVRKIMAFDDEKDIEKMLNINDMPVLAYSINPIGIGKNGMVSCSIELRVVNLATDDEAMIQSTKDFNISVVKTIYSNCDLFESCTMDMKVFKTEENDMCTVLLSSKIIARF